MLMSEKVTYVEHEGYILNKENDHYNVRIMVKSACTDCHIKSACTLSDMSEKIIEVKDDGKEYKANEKVMIVMKSSLGLRAVMLAYIIPFIIILGSLILSLKITANEGMSAAIALLMVVLYYLILYLKKDVLKKSFRYFMRKIPQ